MMSSKEDENAKHSFISQTEFECKFKWFEHCVDTKHQVWQAYESDENRKLLKGLANKRRSVDLNKSKVDLSKFVDRDKGERVSIKRLEGKDDVFVVGYVTEIDKDGNSGLARLMLISNQDAVEAKEVELKNVSITSRLRKRYSSGIIKSVNALERIAIFMGKKKKNTKDTDIDNKIWYQFGTQAKRKGLAKLNLVEMYVVFERTCRSMA